MDVQQRVIAEGTDSWEAELTCRGATFQVEAQLEPRGGQPLWWLEVLRHTSRWTLQPVHHAYYPTLAAAIEAARQAVDDLMRAYAERM